MKHLFSDNKKTVLFFLVLAFLFYGNSLKNGFNIDDSYVTVVNYPVKGQKYIPSNGLIAQGFKGIPKIWQSRYGHEGGMSYDYRPVALCLFAIEYAVFGQSPLVNHLTSILLYTLGVFFLFRILAFCLKEYTFGEPFALLSAVLFLAHPVHSEAVNNIKNCDELLAFLFGLLSTRQFLFYSETKKVKSFLLGILFIVLGLYSKLSAAVFVALIPLILFFFSRIEKKQIAGIFISLIAVFLLHNVLRNLLVTEPDHRTFYHFENPLFGESVSFSTKVLFAFKSLGIYIKLLSIPFPLRFYYGTAMATTHLSLFDPEIILAVLFLLISLFFFFKTKNKLAFFGFLFFLIAIAPVINFVVPMAGIVGERLCFTASAGFIVFTLAVLFTFFKTPPSQINMKLFSAKPTLGLLAVCIIFLFYGWSRNSNWKNELTLFEHDAPYLKRSAAANNLLANKYFAMLSFSKNNPEQALVEKCLSHYQLAYTIDSTVFTAFNNAGVLTFFYLKQPLAALDLFKAAIRSNKIYPQAYENVGDCYVATGEPEKALLYYKKSITQNVFQYRSYLQMIKVLKSRGKFQSALNVLKIASRYFPDSEEIKTEIKLTQDQTKASPNLR